MSVDTIRAIATYTIALVVVVGGFLFLYNISGTDPRGTLVGGFIGSAITFAFGSEIQTRTARQAAAQAAAQSGSNGGG